MAVEYSFDVSAEDLLSEADGFVDGPVFGDDKVFGEDFGEDTSVHGELGQSKFEFVHIAIVRNLFGGRDSLQPCTGISFDVYGNI